MDNNLPDLKANDPVQEDISSLDKLTHSYLFLKKRICETHELIKQYNDKLKECEKLKQDLDVANKQTKTVTYNYNSTLAKVIKLELQNTEYKKSIESLTAQVNEYSIKAAADQQHVQQLICKIKDIERSQNDKIMQYDLEKSSLHVKVKDLEQELKNIKKSYDSKVKRIEKKFPTENDNRAKLRDAGTNTIIVKDIIIRKPQVKEKSTLTDQFYNVKEDLYPIFCAKCEILIEPAPLEKICKIMTNSCPKLIEKISSPQKKVPSPLPISPNLSKDQYKIENLPTPSESPQPHLQNQNTHADFISTNLIPITLNRSDYCNNFPSAPNVMNQGTYYIGSTPIDSLPMTNSNITNQNNHCESITTMASSLSIISSLQKRIDTLETKVKKKLNKQKVEQSNSCCQHHYSNACHVCNVNDSMQFKLIELWKKIADVYKNEKRNGYHIRKKSRKCKLSRLRLTTKRLQSVHTGWWKVESIPKNVEQSTTRRKPKKRKCRYSTLFNKSESLLNSIENLDKLDSDSDADSFIDAFSDTGDSKMNITLKSEDAINMKVSTSQFNKISTNGSEIIEDVRNSAESVKSVGGETDSGMLSDSVESGKLMQLEADLDTCSELEEHNRTDVRSSKEGELCMTENIKLQNPKSAVKSPMKAALNLIKPNQAADKSIISKSVERMDVNAEIEHTRISEASQCNNSVQEGRTCVPNTQNPIRKRKISELQELKKSGNRQDLLRKLKNLKKNKMPVKGCQSVLEQEDAKHEGENFNRPEKQVDINCSLGIMKADDYIPKKKPRIAHIPRSVANEKVEPLNNSLQAQKKLVKSVERIIPQDMQSNYVGLNESEKGDNKLQIMCGSKTEGLNANSMQHKVQEILTEVEHKNSLNVGTNNLHSCIPFDVNNFSDATSVNNGTKTESNDLNEVLEHGQENNSLDISRSGVDNAKQQEDRGLISTPEKSNVDETSCSVEEVSKNVWTKEVSNAKLDTKSHCPLTRLQQHINENKCKSKNYKNQNKKLLHIRTIADQFAKKQLQRLIDGDWQTSVHCDVLEKLVSTCSPRIIAKGIVDFLSSEQECSKTLDNSHTPPAPLMTKSQQKIVALLVDLEVKKPTVFQLVQAGIEYKLFRLNQAVERHAIESLSRMYTVLARIKKDREKVRIFCCDALYCLGLNAIIILYTVFTCWPEVFPNNETNSKLLPKCMVHLVMTQQAADYPKLYALKNLFSVVCKYPMGTLSKDLLAEFLTTLREKSHTEVETAIILLAKREGTAWTYKNIIRGALLPMIINNQLPSTYRAFCLLGNLMRAFPIEDKDNSVGAIVEQLCDLINSGEGSDEQKEGVISALLSLSRHKFNEVVQNTLKYTPSAPLHERTIEQMNGLFNWRPTDFWKGYLKRNKQLLNIQKVSIM